jgi:MFS family permease
MDRRRVRPTVTKWGGLLRQREYLLLWTGNSVSQIGAQVSALAVPLVAVLYLDASVAEVGGLLAFQYAGFFIFGLPAGAWCDRWRRRTTMIVTDLARFLLLGWVPLAAMLDILTIEQMYAVALLAGIATVFFDVASQSYLPSLLRRHELSEGNGKLEASHSVAQVAGPGIAGGLVELLTAPLAVAADAVSFLVSAVCVWRIRRPEERPEPSRQNLSREVAEGIRLVLGDSILRTLMIATALINFCAAVFTAVVMVFLAKTLDLPPGTIGLLMAAGSIGGIVGALAAPAVGRRIGAVRSLWLPLAVGAPIGLLIPATQRGWPLLCFVVGWFGLTLGIVLYNVAQVSIRQIVCPAPFLGRMNATVRFVSWGVMPLGALLGGALGEWTGVRTTVLVACGGLLLAPVVLLRLAFGPDRQRITDIDSPPVPGAYERASTVSGD